MEDIENMENLVTFGQSHKKESYKVTTPVTTSKGISLLNSEPNNNNTNNNNTNFDVVTEGVTSKFPDYLIESMVTANNRPVTFWILHLFSVEGQNEMTSSTITKLLNEKYGSIFGKSIDETTVKVELLRLVRKGVLKRRKPWHIHAAGRGGLRKAYYYSYTSLDALCKAMAAYDKQDFQLSKEKVDRGQRILELLEKVIEILSRIEMKLDLR